MRRPIVAANWKMNMLISNADDWIKGFLAKIQAKNDIDIVIGPPFTALAVLRERIKCSGIRLAGQNMGSEPEGSRTGEISAGMLKDAGCEYVILGHSERRQYLAETDEVINKKISVACDQGLNIIFCIGESLDDRNNGRSNEVIEIQLSSGLADIEAIQLSRLIVAYEPIWAIGTGHTASPEHAQDTHYFIRAWFKKSFGAKHAETTRILYGGSVKPETSESLMNQPDVDGLLVGGASLKPNSFYDIINRCLKD